MSDMRFPTNSIVGFGSVYNGTISAVDLVRIDGQVTGTVKSNNTIVVGINGKVKGTMQANTIIISGLFQGTIDDADVVVLQPTCMVLGTIKAVSAFVDPGAVVQAKILFKKRGGERNGEDVAGGVIQYDEHITHTYSRKQLAKYFNTVAS